MLDGLSEADKQTQNITCILLRSNILCYRVNDTDTATSRWAAGIRPRTTFLWIALTKLMDVRLKQKTPNGHNARHITQEPATRNMYQSL